jgi:hypothetical protein
LPNNDPLELLTNTLEPWSEVRDHNANTNNIKAEYDISTQAAKSKEDVFLQKSRKYREEIKRVKSCSARKRAAKTGRLPIPHQTKEPPGYLPTQK